jgi:hypothetical protein
MFPKYLQNRLLFGVVLLIILSLLRFVFKVL